MKNLQILITILLTCSLQTLFAQGEIKINQIGYYPGSTKIAVVSGYTGGEFSVIDAETGEIVYVSELHAPKSWEFSGEQVSLADFSELTMPGRYRVVHETAGSSYEFEISDQIFRELSKASIKAYYYNRISTELKEEHAGIWARQPGHPDDVVYIHESAASAERPSGTVISSPKGWYDAGDYNKYAVNSGISTYTLLAAYEHFPEYFRNLSLNIPETENGIPDILDEIRWNLDWLLTAQDPHDGGVYHKVTTKNFSGIVMPHEATAERYAVMKSTSGTLNFAAVMATAYRIYDNYDPIFAAKAIAAAKRAWEWAVQNPEQYYIQPADIQTGAYGDRNLSDEFDWAAAELYITTLEDKYWNSRNFHEINVGVPSWSYVRPLAWVSLAYHRDRLSAAADIGLIEQRIIEQGDELLEEYQRSAYRVTMGRYERDFVWGSNGVIGNHSLMLLQAYRVTGDETYLNAAQANLDYILGKNATGYSFVTGFGSKPPMHPHHRQSAADDVDEPVPGFVVGGPQPGQQDGCEYPSDLPAATFLDHWCSYSTNEVAINWNAPLVYLTGAIEYYSMD
jgi:endoglucanase